MRSIYDFVPAPVARYPMNENTVGDNDELIVNGDFADWTGDDPEDAGGNGWDVSGEVGNDPEVSEAATGEQHSDTPTSGGKMCNIYTTGDLIKITQDVDLVIGRKYRFTVNVDTITTGGLKIEIGSSGVDFNDFYSGSETGIQGGTFVAVTGENTTVELRRNVGAADITFDDVSIKLCAVEDSSGNDYDGLAQQDTDAIQVAGKINGAFDFNGSSDFIKVGDIESDVKSIAIWVKPDDVTAHTDYLIDLNGTDYITIVNGTVTKNGFAASTVVIYVDGVVASTVTVNWHLIILTSTVGFDADDLDIGRVSGSGYFGGLADDVMFFDVVLTARQAMKLSDFRGRESAFDPRPNSIYHTNINNKNGIFGGIKEGCIV